MGEREALREREAQPEGDHVWDEMMRVYADAKARAEAGRIIIRGKDQPWQQNTQALLKWYLCPPITDTAASGWIMFVQHIRSHSGRHRHQGGLAIYVIEGRGYTVVDEQRVDWEEGDLLLLPIRPNGMEHQHFNADPSKPCRWLALIPHVLQEQLGNHLTQVESSPDWRGTRGDAPQQIHG